MSGTRSAPELAQELAEEIGGIGIERLGDCEKLGDVHLALIALDHADDRVGALQECGEIALREAAALADTGDDRREGAGGGASEGFQGSALRLAERHTDNAISVRFDFLSNSAYTRAVFDEATDTSREPMSGVYRPDEIEHVRGIAAEVAIGLVKLFWLVIRVPILLVLVILEPLVTALFGALALLGVLTTIFFLLVGPPHFPWITMLAVSLGFVLALVPFYGLIELLSR